MLWDTHMHTHHSGDSDALMPDMIQAAVRQNLDGICFTAGAVSSLPGKNAPHRAVSGAGR